MVVVNHEAPGIPPVLVEGSCDGGGFVELLGQVRWHRSMQPFCLGLRGWMTCMAILRS